MAQSGSGSSVAVDRVASLHTGLQGGFKPRRHLLGRRSLSSRSQHFGDHAIGTLALALEICPMTGYCRLEPRDLRLQHHDPCWQGVSRLATAWSPRRMSQFSKINAHHRLAIIR
jgi:hypothetical protein